MQPARGNSKNNGTTGVLARITTDLGQRGQKTGRPGKNGMGSNPIMGINLFITVNCLQFELITNKEIGRSLSVLSIQTKLYLAQFVIQIKC